MTDTPALVERVVGAIGRLVALAEAIEDEWTYIRDLETVWVARLRAVAGAAAPASADLPPGTQPARTTRAGLEAAIDRLVAEADLVVDPHRAIDWLSTLPQATLIALDEAAW